METLRFSTICQKRSKGGIVGRAFVDDGCGAAGERAVDDVAMAGDPADIGGTPIHVFGADIEDPLHGHGRLQQVAGSAVQNAFGLTGGAGCIENEKGMLGIEWFGGTIFRFLRVEFFVEFVPPEIAAGFHGNVRAGALVDDDMADVRAVFERFIDRAFQIDFFATTPAAIGGDDETGCQILSAGLQRFR